MNNSYINLKKKILNNNAKISVLGIGYIGLPLVLNIAKKFKVVAYDNNKKRINNLNLNKDANNEIKKNFLKKISKNINYTFKDEYLKNTDIFILCIPTPINNNKKPDLFLLKKACQLVSKYLEKGKLVIIESTVYPGCTEKILWNILFNKKKEHFFLGISPERINPGDKKHTLNNIVKVVSGTDKYSLNLTQIFYKKIIKKKNIYTVSNIQIAEMAKLLENSQRDINIAFMNEISQICNSLSVNFKEVLDAANTKWNFIKFTPGLVGGHCIGVDPYYLNYAAKLNKFKPNLVLSGRKINDEMYKFIKKVVIKKLKQKIVNKKNYNILICGASFKENVSDIRNSQSVKLYKSFAKNKFKVDLFDPLVSKTEIKRSYKIILKTKLKNNYYDCIILAVKHNIFFQKKLNFFKKKCRKKNIIFDLKNMFGESGL